MNARGFTLLEMLVSLAVLGLVLAGLTSGTRYGLWVWNRQARLVEGHDQLDAVDRTLRHLVAAMDVGGPPAVSRPAGEPDRFEFNTLLPRVAGLSTRRADVVLAVDSHHRLVLRWREHLHETRFGAPPPVSESELLSGVERVVFSYWRPADARGNAAGWRPTWSDPTPPPLVRIHLDFAPGDPRRWPDIVAANERDSFSR